MSASTTGVVTFDYAIWSSIYPEFGTTCSQPQAQQFFYLACRYCDNTPLSLVPISDAGGNPVRAIILGMLTAHLVQMRLGSVLPSGAAPASPLVGRVSQASEGSVSVSTELDAPQGAAWFTQTKYGLDAWQAMAPYRVGRYIPPPQLPLAAQSYPGWGGLRGWP